jgi:hypothetical protein
MTDNDDIPPPEIQEKARAVQAWLDSRKPAQQPPAASTPSAPSAPSAAPSRPESAEARFRRTQTNRPDVPVARPDWRDPRG